MPRTSRRLVVLVSDGARWGRAHVAPLMASPAFELVGVVAPTHAGWQRSRRAVYGLPRQAFPRRRFPPLGVPDAVPLIRRDDLETPEAIAELEGLRPDVVLSAGFLQIFRGPMLETFAGRLYNSHPSRLPRLRGASPTFWAVANGAHESGVTIHEMVRKVDAGPIVAQVTVGVERGDTTASLAWRLCDAIPEVLERFARALDEPDARPVPQDDAAASWFPPARPEFRRIDWATMDAATVERRVRATDRLAVTHLGPLRLWVVDAAVEDGDRAEGPAPVGTVLSTAGRAARVVTADGVVRVRVAGPKGVPVPLRAGFVLR